MARVDENHIGQEILDLLDLVGRENDRTLLVEVIIQQGVIELPPEQQVEAESGLIEYQQTRIDRQDEGEMQLGDHAFGQLTHTAAHLDVGLCQEVSRARPIESRVNTPDEVERLADAQPPGKHGNIGYEADVLPELIALGARIASEDPQLAIELRQAEHCLESRCLAGG